MGTKENYDKNENLKKFEKMKFHQRLYHSYLGQLKNHSMRTNMITGGFIVWLSDGLCQKQIEKVKEYDKERAGRLISYSILVGAPLNTIWTVGIENRFPGTQLKQIAKKMVAGQFFWGPIMMPVFFTYNELLAGRGFEGVKARLDENYFYAIIKGWEFWGPVAFIMYYLIPVYARVIFAQLASLIWSTFMSWVANSKIEDAPQ